MKKLLVLGLTLVCLVGGTAGVVSAKGFSYAKAKPTTSFNIFSDDCAKMYFDITCNVKPNYVQMNYVSVVVGHYAKKNYLGGMLSDYTTCINKQPVTVQKNWPDYEKTFSKSKKHSDSMYAGGLFETEYGDTVANAKKATR